MTKTTFRNKASALSYDYFLHPSGLKIYLMPLKGMSSVRAIYGTAYGSVDNCFKKADGETVSVPEGIAHFLEHKLFESEEGDAFSLFSKTGAYSNAYTSFDRTCYLFNCTNNLEENLKNLLSFVQSPYFTEATVQKEQGIIGQEIQMYLDAPDWRVLFNLLTALYHNNPVKIDIAGTRESISKITAELLYKCYETFYNPANMFLAIAGDFDEQKVLEVIEKELKNNQPKKFERKTEKEPIEISKPYIEQSLSVAKPMFMVGFKTSAEGYIPADQRLAMELLLECMCGKSSALNKRLREKELISDNLDYEYFCTRNTATVIIGGESDNPQLVRDEILKEIERIKKEGLDATLFDASHRAAYGEKLFAFDKVEGAVSALVESAITSESAFCEIDALANITKSETEKAVFKLESKNSALSVIKPVN